MAETFDLPLTGGLADAIDRKVVKPGNFLRLRNVEQRKKGGLMKRPGYATLGLTINSTVGVVATRGRELVSLADGTSPDEVPGVHAYDAADNSNSRQCDAWTIGYSRRSVTRSSLGAALGQRVVIGSRIVYFWVEGLTAGTLRYRVESTDGAIVKPDTLFGSGSAPGGKFKLLTTNGLAVVVCYVGSGASLTIATLNPTTYAETSATLSGVPYVQSTARQVFDAKALPNAPGLVAVATPSAPTLSTQVIRLSVVNAVTGALVDSADGTTTGAQMSAVQIRFRANGLAAGVAYRRFDMGASFDFVNVAVFSGFTAGGTFNASPDYDKVVFGASDALFASANNTSSFGVGLCQDTVTDPVAPDGWVVVTCGDFSTYAKRIDDVGDVQGNDDFAIASSKLLCEPFSLGGRVVALLGELVSRVHLLDVKNAPLSCALVSLLPGIDAHDGLGVPDPDSRYVTNVCLLEQMAGDYIVELGRASGVEGMRGMMTPSFNADGSVSLAATVLSDGTGVDANKGLDEITFAARGATTTIDMGRTLVTAGGLTARYDGRSWVELGFLHRPVAVFVRVINGGGSIDVGNYVYAVTYEWRDDDGAIHESEPALVSMVATAVNTRFELDVRCIGLTQKPGAAIVFYRTQNNGSLLFRISPRTLDGSADSMVNEPNVSFKTFVDDRTDAQLADLGRGFLYTNGGTRGFVAAPPALHAVRHLDRLWLLSLDRPGEIWPSNEFAEGRPPTFGRGSQLRLVGLPGPLTALASRDDKLFVFTESSIHYLVGRGPADTGQGGEFSQLFDVATDCGCVDTPSVVGTSAGVFFRGPAGIMLVTRGLEVEFVGAPVEDLTDAYPVCRRAVVDATRRRVYWLLSSADLTESTMVVFDYDSGAWYEWPISTDSALVDQTIWRGKHVVSDGRNALRGFGPTPGNDPDGSYVVATIETPELRGFQRAVLTLERLHPHTLNVEILKGYRRSDVTPLQSRSYDLSSTSTVKGLPDAQLEVVVKSQDAASARLRITDAPATGTTNAVERTGFNLSAITITADVAAAGRELTAPDNKRLPPCPYPSLYPSSSAAPSPRAASSVRPPRARSASRNTSTSMASTGRTTPTAARRILQRPCADACRRPAKTPASATC
jgi:hypothetical protein